MSSPKPWSPSALSEIENCPKQYHEVRVKRSVKSASHEQNQWGDYVHTSFEKFFDSDANILPGDLGIHREYLETLHAKDGIFWTEQKVAFDKKAQPTTWEARVEDIWGRFKIDYKKVDMHAGTPIAWVRDWKSGKQKDEFLQLSIYALHTFAQHPVDLVDVRYYWTQSQTETRKIYGRAEVPALWAVVIPKLVRFRDHFRNEAWPPKQSGLCHGWCPVEDCEFWSPKREKKG